MRFSQKPSLSKTDSNRAFLKFSVFVYFTARACSYLVQLQKNIEKLAIGDSTCFNAMYSRVSNRRGGWNKQGGCQISANIINGG